MSITKYLDKASTVLMQKCCSGKHFSSAVLVCRKAGDMPLEYFKVTMEEVLVSSVSEGGGGGEDMQTENISLNFAKVKVEYTPQDATGAGGGASEAGWNIMANEEL